MENNPDSTKPAGENGMSQNQQGDDRFLCLHDNVLLKLIAFAFLEPPSKRLNEKSAKDEAKFEKRLAEAQKEWERKAKLSDEERAAEAQKAKISELEERERQITMRERKTEAAEKLAAKEIPSEFVNYVVDADAEKMNSNIEGLSKVWNSALEKGVKAKLAGKTPEDVGGNNSQGATSNYSQSNGVSSF